MSGPLARPTLDQMEIAAMWLDANEGEGAEGEACAVVAQWVRDKIEQRETKALAKRYRVPVRALRKVTARLEAESSAARASPRSKSNTDP
jgi:hypothetical protein